MSEKTIRNMDDILNEIDRRDDYYNSRIRALKSITFPTKKDGTPFAVFGKNFKPGEGMLLYTPSENETHPKLEYHAKDSKGLWFEDCVDLYLYVDEMRRKNPDDERIKGIENNYSIYRNTYKLTLEECKQAIKDKISLYEKYIADDEADRKAIKKLFCDTDFEKKVLEIRDIIHNFKDSSCKYDLNNYVEYIVKYSR